VLDEDDRCVQVALTVGKSSLGGELIEWAGRFLPRFGSEFRLDRRAIIGCLGCKRKGACISDADGDCEGCNPQNAVEKDDEAGALINVLREDL